MPDGVQILVRANVPPLTLLGAVRSQIAKIDPEQRIAGKTEELAKWISNGPEWRQERLAAWVFPLFGLMAITLAAVGLTALSLTPSLNARMNSAFAWPWRSTMNLLRLVLGSASRSVCFGIAAGIGLTFALGKILAHYANGNTHDAPLLIAAALMMILVAAGASLIPARHASRSTPWSPCVTSDLWGYGFAVAQRLASLRRVEVPEIQRLESALVGALVRVCSMARFMNSRRPRYLLGGDRQRHRPNSSSPVHLYSVIVGVVGIILVGKPYDAVNGLRSKMPGRRSYHHQSDV